MTPKWLRNSRSRKDAILARAVKIGPDDLLVIEVDQAISADQARRVKETIANYVSNPCLVLGAGAKFSVLSR
jgi:ABC-type iron transport system FetAB ATPase subunit